MKEVKISRTNGPCTDIIVCSEFTDAEIEIVKDTLAMVNKTSNHKEAWYVVIDGKTIVPESDNLSRS